MNYLSVCSGVEAASQAWQPLGWKPVAFSEIEPFPCAVLASRFPNVPNLGDMSKIHYNRNTKELYNETTRIICDEGIDLLVGGTPCQSFSVAGKRAGLEGASGLAYHYARLIGEIRPRWFVWENVPGALSSVTYGDQRDFNFLLQQFSVGGDADLGVRWNCCWRVLDTQYVRVEQYPRAIPQRRRRVFVVGHLATDCGGGCEVLLEQEGVRGNPAPRRVKGQGTSRDTAAGVGGADGAGTIETQSFDCLASQNIDHCEKAYERAETCRRQDSCGVGVAIFFKGGQSSAGGLGVDEGACQTMQSNMSAIEPTVDIGIGRDVFNAGKNAKFGMSIGEEVQPGLIAKGGSHICSATVCALCCEDRNTVSNQMVSQNKFIVEKQGEPAVNQYHYAVRRITPIEGERLQGFSDGWTRPCFAPDQITDALVDQFIGIHQNWSAINGKPDAKPKSREAIRKWLTTISSADCPDGPRYKAIGNSMSVNVMNWIGQRIQQEECQ